VKFLLNLEVQALQCAAIELWLTIPTCCSASRVSRREYYSSSWEWGLHYQRRNLGNGMEWSPDNPVTVPQSRRRTWNKSWNRWNRIVELLGCVWPTVAVGVVICWQLSVARCRARVRRRRVQRLRRWYEMAEPWNLRSSVFAVFHLHWDTSNTSLDNQS